MRSISTIILLAVACLSAVAQQSTYVPSEENLKAR